MKSRQKREFSSWLANFPSRQWDERRSLNFYMRAYHLTLAVAAMLLIVASPWPWLAALLLAVSILTASLVPGKSHVQGNQQAKCRRKPAIRRAQD